jgi:hypothetical protein
MTEVKTKEPTETAHSIIRSIREDARFNLWHQVELDMIINGGLAALEDQLADALERCTELEVRLESVGLVEGELERCIDSLKPNSQGLVQVHKDTIAEAVRNMWYCRSSDEEVAERVGKVHTLQELLNAEQRDGRRMSDRVAVADYRRDIARAAIRDALRRHGKPFHSSDWASEWSAIEQILTKGFEASKTPKGEPV